MVHHPEIGGQKRNIQLNVTPEIPKLIKGNLLGEWTCEQNSHAGLGNHQRRT